MNGAVRRRTAKLPPPLLGLALWAVAPCAALAQDPFPETEADPFAYAAPLEVLLRMDLNGDGVLEHDEIPRGAENFAVGMALDADIDPRQAFSLAALSESWLQFAERKQRRELAQAPAPPQDSLQAAVEEAEIRWADVGRFALAIAAARGAEGLDSELEVVARLDRNRDGVLHPDEIPDAALIEVGEFLYAEGFSPFRRVRLSDLARARKIRNGRHSDVRRPAPRNVDAEQTERNAATLLATYDADEDGVLQESEWTRLSPDWKRADRNRDRRLSVVEVSAHLRSLTGEASRRRP